MKRCDECGAVLEDGFRFCPQCAASIDSGGGEENAARTKLRPHYCGKCGAKLPTGHKACLICGTAAGQPPPPEDMEVREVEEERNAGGIYGKRKHRKMAHTALLMCALILLSALGLWGWDVIPYLLSTDKMRADNAILYLREDGSLRLKSLSSTDPITIHEGLSLDGEGHPAAVASENGRYLAYLDGEGTLLLADLGALTRPNASTVVEGIPLAHNVGGWFSFSGNGDHVVYLDREGGLYANDLESSWLLAEEVDGVYDVSEKAVLYYRGMGSGRTGAQRLELLVHPLAQNGEETRIDNDVSQIVDWTPGFDRLLYTRVRQNPETGGYVYDAVACDRTKNQRQILASEVDWVVDGSAAGNAVLYLSARDYSLDYEDLVEDDLEAADDGLGSPSISDYPALEDYYQLYGELPADLDIMDEIDQEDEELRSLIQELAHYLQELQDYQEKEERDHLRRQLKQEIRAASEDAIQLYYLVHYSDGDERVISNYVTGTENGRPEIDGSLDRNYVLYCTIDDPADLERVSLSELLRSDAYSLTQLIQSGQKTSLWGSMLDRDPVLLRAPDSESVIRQPFAQGRFQGAYYQLQSDGDSGEGSQLYYISISGGIPSESSLVDQNVNFCFPGDLFDSNLLYGKDFGDGTFSLYAANRADPELLSYNVSAGAYLGTANGGKSLLYYENFDSSTGSGDLYLTVEQKRLLSSDVAAFDYRGDNMIYLLKNATGGGGDLYAYSDGILTLVDSGVTLLLSMSGD